MEFPVYDREDEGKERWQNRDAIRTYLTPAGLAIQAQRDLFVKDLELKQDFIFLGSPKSKHARSIGECVKRKEGRTGEGGKYIVSVISYVDFIKHGSISWEKLIIGRF